MSGIINFFVVTMFLFTYYGALSFQGCSDNILWVITSALSNFEGLDSVYFLLTAANGAASDYYVGSLRFNHVGNGMCLSLASNVVNILSDFGFYQVSRKIRLRYVHTSLLFNRMNE